MLELEGQKPRVISDFYSLQYKLALMGEGPHVPTKWSKRSKTASTAGDYNSEMRSKQRRASGVSA